MLIIAKIFNRTIESEESIPKSTRIIQPCDKIRIAPKNETKKTKHQRNTEHSLLINRTLNKQV